MNSIALRRGLLLAAVMLGVLSNTAGANTILKLGFGANLDDWTVSDLGYVALASEQATITESALNSAVTIYRDFVVPTDPISLSFTLVTLTPESPGGGLPSAFNVMLLDPTNSASLISTVDNFTTAYYIRDLTSDVDAGQTASGVTLDPASGIGLPLVVTADISGLIAGTTARIQFMVLSSSDLNESTSVTLENVQVVSGVVIPEPTTIVMTSIGALSLAGYGLVCRRAWRRERAA